MIQHNKQKEFGGSKITVSSESSGNLERERSNKDAENIVKKEVRMTDFGIDKEGNEKALH